MHCQVTDYAVFGGPTSENIPLVAPSPHATFECSSSIATKVQKLSPNSSTCYQQQTGEQMGGVIIIPHPEYCALSIDSRVEQMKTIYTYKCENVFVYIYVCPLYPRAGTDGSGQTLYIRNPQGPT